VNGEPAVVAWTGTEPFLSMSLLLVDGRVQQVLIVRNPDNSGACGRQRRTAPRLTR
jgi:hypothetical protein